MEWVNFLENILLTINVFCFDWLYLCMSSILSKRDGLSKGCPFYVLYQLFLERGSLNLIKCSPNFCHKCNYKSLNLSLNLLTIFIGYYPGYIYNFKVTPQILLRKEQTVFRILKYQAIHFHTEVKTFRRKMLPP